MRRTRLKLAAQIACLTVMTVAAGSPQSQNVGAGQLEEDLKAIRAQVDQRRVATRRLLATSLMERAEWAATKIRAVQSNLSQVRIPAETAAQACRRDNMTGLAARAVQIARVDAPQAATSLSEAMDAASARTRSCGSLDDVRVITEQIEKAGESARTLRRAIAEFEELRATLETLRTRAMDAGGALSEAIADVGLAIWIADQAQKEIADATTALQGLPALYRSERNRLERRLRDVRAKYRGLSAAVGRRFESVELEINGLTPPSDEELSRASDGFKRQAEAMAVHVSAAGVLGTATLTVLEADRESLDKACAIPVPAPAYGESLRKMRSGADTAAALAEKLLQRASECASITPSETPREDLPAFVRNFGTGSAPARAAGVPGRWGGTWNTTLGLLQLRRIDRDEARRLATDSRGVFRGELYGSHCGNADAEFYTGDYHWPRPPFVPTGWEWKPAGQVLFCTQGDQATGQFKGYLDGSYAIRWVGRPDEPPRFFGSINRAASGATPHDWSGTRQ